VVIPCSGRDRSGQLSLFSQKNIFNIFFKDAGTLVTGIAWIDMDLQLNTTALLLQTPVAGTAITVVSANKGRAPFLLDVRVEVTGKFPSFVIRLIIGNAPETGSINSRPFFVLTRSPPGV
jgi:hypothetical protein